MDSLLRDRLLRLSGIELRALPPVVEEEDLEPEEDDEDEADLEEEEEEEEEDEDDEDEEDPAYARHRTLLLLGVELRARGYNPAPGRQVFTPEGAKKYGLPIGATITPGMRRLTEAQQQKVADLPEAQREKYQAARKAGSTHTQSLAAAKGTPAKKAAPRKAAKKATPQAKEKAAVDRQDRIDKVKGTAATLAEVLQIVNDGGSNEALKHRINARVKRGDLDEKTRDRLFAAIGGVAMSSDDRAELVQDIDRLSDLLGRGREAFGELGKLDSRTAPRLAAIAAGLRDGSISDKDASGRLAALAADYPRSVTGDSLTGWSKALDPPATNRNDLGRAVDRIAEENGLTITAEAGDVVAWTPETGLLGLQGGGFRKGTFVSVVRPGVQYDPGDGKVAVVQGLAEEATPEEIADAKKAADRKAAKATPDPTAVKRRLQDIAEHADLATAEDEAGQYLDSLGLTAPQMKTLAQGMDVPLIPGGKAQHRKDILKVLVSGHLMSRMLRNMVGSNGDRQPESPKFKPGDAVEVDGVRDGVRLVDDDGTITTWKGRKIAPWSAISVTKVNDSSAPATPLADLPEAQRRNYEAILRNAADGGTTKSLGASSAARQRNDHIDELVDSGYLEQDGESFVLTDKGRQHIGDAQPFSDQAAEGKFGPTDEAPTPSGRMTAAQRRSAVAHLDEMIAEGAKIPEFRERIGRQSGLDELKTLRARIASGEETHWDGPLIVFNSLAHRYGIGNRENAFTGRAKPEADFLARWPLSRLASPARPAPRRPAARARASGRDIVSDREFAERALTDGDEFAGDYVFRSIARQQGFDGPPRLVSSSELDSLATNDRPVLYRGVIGGQTDDGPISAAEIQDQMRSGPAVFGSGFYGSGYYFGDDLEAVEADYSDGTEGSISRAVLKPDANIVDFDEVNADWERFKSDTSDNDVTRSVYGADLGRYAAGRGYDAIRAEDGIYVVLNRTALNVEKPNSDPTESLRDDLDLKKVPELKQMLRDAGLKVSGTKAELIARLRGAPQARDRMLQWELRDTPGRDEFEAYWTRGEGLARWLGHPHEWTTLRNLLRKHPGIRDPEGLATKYFHKVKGFYPGADLHRVEHGKPPRGDRIGPG